MVNSRDRKRKAAGGDDEPAAQAAVMDPEILLAEVREEEQTELQSLAAGQGRAGLNHLIRTVQGILETNDDIWEKCASHRFESFNGSPHNWCFKRVVFSKIEVKTTKHDSCNTLLFTTKAEFETMEFSRPEPPPEPLTYIFTLSMVDKDGLPDYEDFFRRSLLLQDDVLLPFLVSLKNHLESVQVYLKNIDTWLRMQPAALVAFMKEHFALKKLPANLELLAGDEIEGCDKRCRAMHGATTKCVTCGMPFSSHQVVHQSSRMLVPNTTCQSMCRGSFFDAFSQTLKSCQVPGEHTETFDISKDGEKERLVKFLQYIAIDSE